MLPSPFHPLHISFSHRIATQKKILEFKVSAGENRMADHRRNMGFYDGCQMRNPGEVYK